jgi:drug/metabolite transporter (DMT)-like permease
MNSSGAAAGLGLISAATWGGSDFVGGLGARRAPALMVVASGHIFSLLLMLALCLGIHLALPGSPYLFYAALGGFEGSIALAVFYRALAMGAMGLTAALTGLLTALIPVLFSLFHDGLPTPLTAAGLAMGLIAIWLITRSPAVRDATTPPAALLLGALAGIGFGTQLILFKFASPGGILWTMTSARAAGSVAMILVLLIMPPKEKWRGFWLAGIAAGTLDTVGNLFYLRATQIGRLDVAALVCSLYPAGTILLAALVLREWPSRRQFAGIALALAAVVLLSV